MGNKLLTILISFLLLSQQVFSSFSRNNESNNKKKWFYNEEEDFADVDFELLPTGTSCSNNDCDYSYINDFDSQILNSSSGSKRKRKNFKEKRVKKRSKYEDEELDFDHFEAELGLYSSSPSSFKEFFNETVSIHPENTESLVNIVVNSENLDMILVLYQEGYKINLNELRRKRILSAAFRTEKMKLIEFLLEDNSNPLEYCDELGIILDSRMIETLKYLKKPTRENDIMKKVSDYRRSFIQNVVHKSYPHAIVIPDRSQIFQYTYENVRDHEMAWYSGFMRPFIVFEGEIGIDHGGITAEWIEILIESFFKEDSGRVMDLSRRHQSSSSSVYDDLKDFRDAFFIESGNGIFVPNTKYPVKLFKMIGSIFAMAFNYDVPLKFDLLPAFYRSLTGDNNSRLIPEDELKFIDEEFYTGLVALRNLDLLPLGLEFMGQPVTSDNLESYIAFRVAEEIELKYKDHLDALKIGFYSLMNAGKFEELNLKSGQLREIMLGSTVLTAEDFLKHVNVSKLTHENTRKWIFEVVSEFGDKDRLLLFKFITSRRSAPFDGLKNLVTPISFASVHLQNTGHLPTASTCGSLMKIPVYSSKDMLREKLTMAIYNCETFDLE